MHQAAALSWGLYTTQLAVGVKHLTPGTVGCLTLAAATGAGQEGETTGVAQADQLLQQTRLPHAGLTLNQQEALTSSLGIVKSSLQAGQLGLPSDHGCAGLLLRSSLARWSIDLHQADLALQAYGW